MNILAIDAGNIESGVCIISGENYKPLWFGKFDNDDLLADNSVLAQAITNYSPSKVVFEEVANYGSMVGLTIYHTCIAIGRIYQWLLDNFRTDTWLHTKHGENIPLASFTPDNIEFVKRKTYITDLTNNPKANDPIVKRYLIDRFAPDTPNYGKGTKKAQGFFYGMSQDAWTAYAICVWALDNEKGNISHT